ncbi:MAG: type II toxin-antitoxin system Phd/YefM family antitoxin [Verrucomicrobia bacterium]|nr:type II toxin-antitoxin system Phd/YefM family antitoxin [Verrucomicrobiota bacterium]
MTTVNVKEAAASFPTLLAAVEEKGETVVICREGKPVAELKAAAQHPKVDRLKPNPDLKPLWVAPDFDPAAPATENEWPEANR